MLETNEAYQQHLGLVNQANGAMHLTLEHTAGTLAASSARSAMISGLQFPQNYFYCLQAAQQESSVSDGHSDAVNVPSPGARLPHRHRTKLYTAILDVDIAANSAAPLPVDLVSPILPGQSSMCADSHTQPAALQTEPSGAVSPAAGRLLILCIGLVLVCSFRHAHSTSFQYVNAVACVTTPSLLPRCPWPCMPMTDVNSVAPENNVSVCMHRCLPCPCHVLKSAQLYYWSWILQGACWNVLVNLCRGCLYRACPLTPIRPRQCSLHQLWDTGHMPSLLKLEQACSHSLNTQIADGGTLSSGDNLRQICFVT